MWLHAFTTNTRRFIHNKISGFILLKNYASRRWHCNGSRTKKRGQTANSTPLNKDCVAVDCCLPWIKQPKLQKRHFLVCVFFFWWLSQTRTVISVRGSLSKSGLVGSLMLLLYCPLNVVCWLHVIKYLYWLSVFLEESLFTLKTPAFVYCNCFPLTEVSCDPWQRFRSRSHFWTLGLRSGQVYIWFLVRKQLCGLFSKMAVAMANISRTKKRG